MSGKIYPNRESIKCNGHNRKGEICGRWAMMGMTKCKYHGGASLKGAASPLLIHGRYSKYLPESLQEKYLIALHDPNLLQLRDDVALMDARLGEMFEKLKQGESGGAWISVSKAFQKLRSARDEGMKAMEFEAMHALEDAIEKGVSDLESWQEIHATVDQRRRLVADEYKVQVNLKQMMSAEKAMSLLAAVVEAIKRAVNLHCQDKKQAQRILQTVSTDLAVMTNLKENEPRLALQAAMENG